MSDAAGGRQYARGHTSAPLGGRTATSGPSIRAQAHHGLSSFWEETLRGVNARGAHRGLSSFWEDALRGGNARGGTPGASGEVQDVQAGVDTRAGTPSSVPGVR